MRSKGQRQNRRAWLQRKTLEILKDGSEYSCREILAKMRDDSKGWGWASCSATALGQMLRQLEGRGFIIRNYDTKYRVYSYKISPQIDQLDVEGFFGGRGLHPKQRRNFR
jgi:DNA-binding PadR family transcriptional regulator